MTITTDYREHTNQDSLQGAALSKYRLSHWLCDILKNFMSSPINIKDERLCKLLLRQDNEQVECLASFLVDVPYTTDTRKACTTPAILVSAGATAYPMTSVNLSVNAPVTAIGAHAMGLYSKQRDIQCNVAVVAESADGVMLLAGLIEDFLLQYSSVMVGDGMVSSLTVTGSSAPQQIGAGSATNAKDIYQIVISLQASGGISWTLDTQGPVFRGVTLKTALE